MIDAAERSEGRKRILIVPKPFQLTPANLSRQEKEEGGRQDGWRRVKDRDMVTAVPNIPSVPPFHAPDSPSPSQFSNPIMQEAGLLPFDLSGMFSSSVPAAAAAAAELPAPDGHKLTEWSL